MAYTPGYFAYNVSNTAVVSWLSKNGIVVANPAPDSSTAATAAAAAKQREGLGLSGDVTDEEIDALMLLHAARNKFGKNGRWHLVETMLQETQYQNGTDGHNWSTFIKQSAFLCGAAALAVYIIAMKIA